MHITCRTLLDEMLLTLCSCDITQGRSCIATACSGSGCLHDSRLLVGLGGFCSRRVECISSDQNGIKHHTLVMHGRRLDAWASISIANIPCPGQQQKGARSFQQLQAMVSQHAQGIRQRQSGQTEPAETDVQFLCSCNDGPTLLMECHGHHLMSAMPGRGRA